MENFLMNLKAWFGSNLAKAGNFTLSNLLPAVILAAIGLVAIILLDKLMAKLLAKSKLEKAGHGLIRAIFKAALILLFALIVASKLGIDVTGVVALASVLTLAISLSVQNLLTNVIGGLTLLSTKPFKSGDFVEIAGQQGTVLEISMTYTKLATRSLPSPTALRSPPRSLTSPLPAAAVWTWLSPPLTPRIPRRCWTLCVPPAA